MKINGRRVLEVIALECWTQVALPKFTPHGPLMQDFAANREFIQISFEIMWLQTLGYQNTNMFAE